MARRVDVGLHAGRLHTRSPILDRAAQRLGTAAHSSVSSDARRYQGREVDWPAPEPARMPQLAGAPRAIRATLHVVAMGCLNETIASAWLEASLARRPHRWRGRPFASSSPTTSTTRGWDGRTWRRPSSAPRCALATSETDLCAITNRGLCYATNAHGTHSLSGCSRRLVKISSSGFDLL